VTSEDLHGAKNCLARCTVLSSVDPIFDLPNLSASADPMYKIYYIIFLYVDTILISITNLLVLINFIKIKRDILISLNITINWFKDAI
jgi:hypothetical protein